jgi:hypothetical protein
LFRSLKHNCSLRYSKLTDRSVATSLCTVPVPAPNVVAILRMPMSRGDHWPWQIHSREASSHGAGEHRALIVGDHSMSRSRTRGHSIAGRRAPPLNFRPGNGISRAEFQPFLRTASAFLSIVRSSAFDIGPALAAWLARAFSVAGVAIAWIPGFSS